MLDLLSFKKIYNLTLHELLQVKDKYQIQRSRYY